METLSLLRDVAEAAPERYVAVAKLMLLDLEYLNEEGLDHLSRMMEDVERRLELKDVGKKVQDEEKEIVARLDKMIDKIENQKNKGGGCGAGTAHTSPVLFPREAVPLQRQGLIGVVVIVRAGFQIVDTSFYVAVHEG